MRKKIEELRNREEGFTLVELLAVIVILGIIVAIAIPAVGKVIDRAQTDAAKQEVALVKDAARLYVTANQEELAPKFTAAEGNTIKVGTEALESEGYLEERNEGGVVSGIVEVTKDTTKGTYKYKFTSSEVKTEVTANPLKD